MISPGKTTGLSALASSLMLSTLTPRKLRDFIQVEIVRDDLAFELARKLYELVINFAHVREIGLADYDLVAALLFLEPLEDVQAAPSPVALYRIGAVGYLLKLAQDELRDDQRPGQKARLGDIGHAAVDYHGRVEYERVRFARPLLYEYPSERCEIEIIALDRADH